MLLVGAACVVAVFVPIAADTDFGLPVNDDKQMATINTVAAVASFVLVLLAGAVAIVAYRFASGTPDLDVEVRFPFMEANAPKFGLKAAEPGAERREFADFKQLDGTVVVYNRSRYSARNPGVRIHFHGIVNLLQDMDGWETTQWITTGGIAEIQWDGGADRIIHGEWSRTLPPIALRGASIETWRRRPPRLEITLVADGIRPKTIEIPIGWEVDPPVAGPGVTPSEPRKPTGG